MTEEGQLGDIEDQFARFSSTTDAKGKATITIVLDPGAEDKAGLVRDKLSKVIQNLIRTENQALKVLPKLEKEEKEISDHLPVRISSGKQGRNCSGQDLQRP